MCIRDSDWRVSVSLAINGFESGRVKNKKIVDIENGNRFETYTIAGEPGSGVMCLNGAAARQVQVGDHIILCLLYTSRCV